MRKSSLVCFLALNSVLSLADTHYVNPSSSTPVSPYTNWPTAATTIEAAVGASSPNDMIIVTNGTYYPVSEIQVYNNKTIRSVNGASVTTVDAQNLHRVFKVSYGTIDGFTIVNGYTNDGAGVYMYGGVVQNCIIRSNYARETSYPFGRGGGIYAQNDAVIEDSILESNKCYGGPGAGIFCLKSTVRNCIVRNNYFSPAAGECQGAGIYCATTSLVENCTILGNRAESTSCQWAYGGGVSCEGGSTVRNCLIINNTVYSQKPDYLTYYAHGGGIWVYDGTVENCTIASNSVNCVSNEFALGGGVYLYDDAVVRNCIIYHNKTAYQSSNYYSLGVNCTYAFCCSSPLISTGPGHISSLPLFVDRTVNNYRLQTNSPCVDTGTNQSWMTSATDLDGSTRVVNGRVDMGAYEFQYVKLRLFSAYAGLALNGLPVQQDQTNYCLAASSQQAAVTNSPILDGTTTQFLCRGWTAIGSIPSNPTGGTNTGPFVITNDTTVTWAWSTNYWLDARTNGMGAVSITNGWFAKGSNVLVFSTPSAYWHFLLWTGDTNACPASGTNITAVMTGPRILTANFAETLTSHGTPHWWLAVQLLTNTTYPTFEEADLADQDADRMMTWAEYFAGTQATNGDSVLTLLYVEDSVTPTGIVVRWTSVDNKTYALIRSTNLNAGFINSIATNLSSTAPTNSFTDTNAIGTGPYFYQIEVRRD